MIFSSNVRKSWARSNTTKK
ncbi:unnamed protein product [Linum tenue]|uniref:Uncharacterized protein n=1 Tax=Linum tenue TaxID=586396 RepID=A0AAV0NWN6_9ROSI|nr:unnamed protein product [Linum tenue]